MLKRVKARNQYLLVARVSSVICLGAVVLICGCRKSPVPSASAVTLPLPALAVEDIPSPAEATVTIQRGSNLQEIGGAAYGHRRFAGFVAAFNGLPNPERVVAGTVLRTPSLAVCFREAGIAPEYLPAICCLAKACTDYYAIEPAYLKARGDSGVSNGKFAIPQSMKDTMDHCVALIGAALPVLRAARPPHTVPTMTIGQFQQAADQIRELASGSIDGYGYDYDLVGQRFALAFTNALIWTQKHHQ